MPTVPGGRSLIQARVLPKYPVGVAGEAGVSFTIENGIMRGALDYQALAEDETPDAKAYVLAVQDRGSGEYRTVGMNATGATYGGTSSSNFDIADDGAVTFLTQTGLAYTRGSRVRATSKASGAWMEGTVTSYGNSYLSLALDLSSGSGAYADWSFSIAGQPGLQGPGSGDVHGPDEAMDGRLALFDGETGKLLREGVAPIADLPVAASGVSDPAKVLRSDDVRLADQRVPPDGSVGTAKMQPQAVTNAILAPRAASTFLGRVSPGTGATETLTGAQAASILPTFGQDTKGLAPGPTAAQLASTAILRSDGWGPQLPPAQPVAVVTGSGALNAFHAGRHLVITGSTDLTLTLAAAASLGAGWNCSFEVAGNLIATIAGQAGEQIDGVAGGTRSAYQRQSGRIICDGSGFRVVGVPDEVKLVDVTVSNVAQILLTLPKGFSRFRFFVDRLQPGADNNALFGTASLDGGVTYKTADYVSFHGGITSGATARLQMVGAGAISTGYVGTPLTGKAEIFPGDASTFFSAIGESWYIYSNSYSRQIHGTGFIHSNPANLGRVTNLKLEMATGNISSAKCSFWGIA